MVPSAGPAVKLGITLNPLPPGVQDQTIGIAMVFSDLTRDWGAEALNELQALERAEPHENLEPDHCRVLVRTSMQPVSFQKVAELKRYADGRTERTDAHEALVTWTPPNETFVRRFSEPDGMLRLDRLHTTAQRVRSYLAFCAGFPVPVVAIVASKDFLRAVRLECDPDRYPLARARGLPSDSEMAAWTTALEQAYLRGQSLLNHFPPDEPKGRAISLVGAAIWAEEPEERFFYAWRALEVIATYDLAAVRRNVLAGDLTRASLYFDRKAVPLVSEQNVVIDPLEKVAVSVQSRVPETRMETIERYYALRNAIAHGTVSPEEHLEVLKASVPITALALQTANSCIEENGPVLS